MCCSRSAFMIKLYGGPMSRTFRVMWMLEELGVPYAHVSFHLSTGAHKTPEYLAMNPNSHVPTLVDSDLVLWESFAINMHLGSVHGNGALMGATPAQRATIYKWTLWGACEVEGPADTAAKLSMKISRDWLQARFCVLEPTLEGRAYLAGANFTVADLNVHSLLYRPAINREDVMALPKVADWVNRISARPAFQRTMEKRKG